MTIMNNWYATRFNLEFEIWAEKTCEPWIIAQQIVKL
jgi:hypothetical protein